MNIGIDYQDTNFVNKLNNLNYLLIEQETKLFSLEQNSGELLNTNSNKLDFEIASEYLY